MLESAIACFSPTELSEIRKNRATLSRIAPE